ncbi:hypothetical protein JCM8097_004693 [Rhodosporidiobolus ruineniae]
MLDLDGRVDGSPVYDLSTLDPDGVHQLFTDLGFPHYHDQLQEHGITGEVLVHLDHAALKDVGVHSVGQRLAILKTVYDLKVRQNIPIEEGHYVPPSEEWDLDRQPASQQVLGLLSERDDRIRNLETEVHSLHAALINLREETLSLARSAGGVGKPRPNVRSPTAPSFPHPLSNASTLSRSSSTPSRPRNLPPVAAAAAQNLALPGGGLGALPDSPASPIIDSPRIIGAGDYQQQQQVVGLHPHGQHAQEGTPSLLTTMHPGEFSINGVATPTTPTAPMLIHPDSAASGTSPLAPLSANPLTASTATSPSTLLGPPSLSRPSTAATSADAHSPSSTLSPNSSALSSSRTSTSRGDGASSSADNPYRSFRVTLEDPCYKVLPAALKKYKINDDWRLYALFICYGNTERCLAYDEKPLLLFQKLKESNDNPVFMLRHIKDIKSPIAVASAKHAARREKRPPGIGGGVERSLMGVTRDGTPAPPGSSTSSAPPAAGANGLAPNARPTRLHHAPVLLPVGKDREKEEGADGAPPPAQEPERKNGYCIAIYPYLAEREDEFDVAVGDTFVILSKTKGWWVVHRDSPPPSTSSSSDHSPAARKSAWVPAGCLLETSIPPLSLLSSSDALSSSTGSSSASKSPGGPTSAGVPPHEGNAANVPILPSYVVSVSTPGICLMDYAPRGQGELEVRKGQPLRILKRYNHWSYAIKDDGGRGWVPSWFCGRANKGDGTPTTPTISASGAAAQSQSQSATSSALLSSASAPSSTLALSSTPASDPSSSSSSSGRPATAPSSGIGAGSLSRKPSLSVSTANATQGMGMAAAAGAKSAGAAAEGVGSLAEAAKGSVGGGEGEEAV